MLRRLKSQRLTRATAHLLAGVLCFLVEPAQVAAAGAARPTAHCGAASARPARAPWAAPGA